MKKLTKISNLDLSDWSGSVQFSQGEYFYISFNSASLTVPVSSEQAQELQFLSAIKCLPYYKIGKFITPYWSEDDLNPSLLGDIVVHERDFKLSLFLEQWTEGNVTIEAWNDFVDNFKIELVKFTVEEKELEVIKFSVREFCCYMLDGVMYPAEIPVS